MLKMKSVISALVLIVGGLVLFEQAPAVAENTLKIGAVCGLTGPGSKLGLTMKDAAVLATEWINNKGGISVGGEKYKIELIVEDNKNTAEGCVSAATKLVHRDKVKFVTGMNAPFQIEAVQSVTEPNKVILNAGKLTILNPNMRYTFSGSEGYTVPIPLLYDFLVKTYPRVKKIGFTSNDEPGSLGTIKFAREIAKKHGLELNETVLTQFDTKDYYPAWTKILRDNPDAVDLGINFPDYICAIAKHGRELGFKGPMITTSPEDAAVFVDLIGKEGATDFIWPGFDIHAPDNPPMSKEINKLWEERFKRTAVHGAYVGWSTIWALTQAIEKAQTLDTTEIVKTWENLKEIQTPWGMGYMGGARTFGINHMVITPTPISRLLKTKVDSTQWYKPEVP
jgi:branched-chain amino acid transport system substrate-binding protein